MSATAPWFRCHALPGSLKVTGRLMAELGVSRAAAVGHLAMLWGAVSVFCTDGDLSDTPDATLETWSGWTGTPGAFSNFVRVTHCDSHGRLNEYDEYGGRLEAVKKLNRERKRRQRDRIKSVESPERESVPDNSDVVTQTSRGGHAAVTPYVDVTIRGSTYVAVSPALVTALTVAANQAITARFGEQPRPLVASSGPARAFAERLAGAGVPVAFAARVLAAWAQETTLAHPPRSASYFAPVVLDAWERQQAREAAAAAPLAEPLRVPKTDSRGSGRAGGPPAGQTNHDNALAAADAVAAASARRTP